MSPSRMSAPWPCLRLRRLMVADRACSAEEEGEEKEEDEVVLVLEARARLLLRCVRAMPERRRRWRCCRNILSSGSGVDVCARLEVGREETGGPSSSMRKDGPGVNPA